MGLSCRSTATRPINPIFTFVPDNLNVQVFTEIWKKQIWTSKTHQYKNDYKQDFYSTTKNKIGPWTQHREPQGGTDAESVWLNFSRVRLNKVLCKLDELLHNLQSKIKYLKKQKTGRRNRKIATKNFSIDLDTWGHSKNTWRFYGTFMTPIPPCDILC